jgi:ATP-dependent Clp protease protease subunit
MNKLGTDFRKFARSNGIASTTLDSFQNSLTPYILEEREMRATQMDIFSRLMMERILWVSGEVDDRMSDIVQAQLLFLDSVDNKDITLYINSPGGSVLHGLGIVDLMNYIKSDVATTNIGMCASMGSILLSSGTKGKRSSLIHSKVMTHQVSHGTHGNVQDTRIDQMEAEKYNYILFKMLAKNSGKTFEEVEHAIWDVLAEIKSKQLSNEELHRLKNKIRTAKEFQEQGLLNRTMNLCYFELLGDANGINEEAILYEKIQAEHIQAVANEILQENNCTLLKVKAI